MSKKYFVEFEFQSKVGKIYWLPIFINESDKARAHKIASNIKKAISNNFKILTSSGPVLVIQGYNSELYNEYVSNNLKGKLSILNIHYWELKDIDPQEDLSFDQHLQFVDYNPKQFANKTLAEGETIKFPVKVVMNGISDHTEFLVIDVVKPKL